MSTWGAGNDAQQDPRQMLQVPSAPRLTAQESQSPPLRPLPSQPTVDSHMSAHFPPSPTLSCLEPSANLTSKALITHTHSHLFVLDYPVGLTSVEHRFTNLVIFILMAGVGECGLSHVTQLCRHLAGEAMARCCHSLSRVGFFMRNLEGNFR